MSSQGRPRASRCCSFACWTPPKRTRARRRASSGGHAVADVFFDGEIDVALEFGVEVGVALLLVEEGQHAVEGFANGSH